MNRTLLEAQARVCTGPHQTRPLGLKADDLLQPEPVLEIILQSLAGQLPETEQASMAQIGAFLAAMTIRQQFPPETRWSPAEAKAMDLFGLELERHAPPELRFLYNPSNGLTGANASEKLVVVALTEILRGEHLPYAQALQTCQAVLSDQVHPALKAAIIIGQRMNLESFDEVQAYLDSVYPPDQVEPIAVETLTHFGQPFDGATRYFRLTLFVAAIRAALGLPTLLHGVDLMPPKNGVTEEQILKVLGAKIDYTLVEARELLEDPAIGFAYVSQRAYAPQAYNLRQLRVEIQKRPPWAATEKVQQLFSAQRANYMVIGYYHSGYETKLLRLAAERGIDAAVAVKGEEGSSHYALRVAKPTTADRKAVNFAQGFRLVSKQRVKFAMDIDPKTYGFDYQTNPRPTVVTAEAFAQAGVAALSGQKGQIYDRLILNTAVTDYLLGSHSDPHHAIEQTRVVVDNGQALAHLNRYLEKQ